MAFRRQPFQFTTIDPAKRQAELQKRFGLPTNEMYVDCLNPGIMGSVSRRSNSGGSSPRLQHRVPAFGSGLGEAKTSQNNVDNGHKPRVRVIPIEVEGADGSSKRHRTLSGSPGSADSPQHSSFKQDVPVSIIKPSNTMHVDGSREKPSQPRVYNVPIQREHKNQKVDEPSIPISKAKQPDSGKGKPAVATEPVPKAPQKPAKLYESVPLKKIENVLGKLEIYQEEVEKFVGTIKDKQYRYLDEMLTRCMLDLDNIETMGSDRVRQSRKAAIKKVQAYIDLLESNVNAQSAATNVDQTATPENTTEVDTEMVDAPAEESADRNEQAPELDSVLESPEVTKMEEEVVTSPTTDSDMPAVVGDQGSTAIANDTVTVNISIALPTDVEMEENPASVSSGLTIEEIDATKSELEITDNPSSESVTCSETVQPIVTEPLELSESSKIDSQNTVEQNDLVTPNNDSPIKCTVTEIGSDEELEMDKIDSLESNLEECKTNS